MYGGGGSDEKKIVMNIQLYEEKNCSSDKTENSNSDKTKNASAKKYQILTKSLLVRTT